MSELQEEFAIEHYKFLLIKIQQIDESVYKNIGVYIKLITSVLAFVIGATLAKEGGKISAELLNTTFSLATLLIVFISSTFILMTIANIFSWRDYRKEEIAILNHMSIDIGRKEPTFKNMIRWTETWFIISAILVSIASIFMDCVLN